VENPSRGSRVVRDGRRDGQRDMIMLIVSFRILRMRLKSYFQWIQISTQCIGNVHETNTEIRVRQCAIQYIERNEISARRKTHDVSIDVNKVLDLSLLRPHFNLTIKTFV
jgi:hypothetical protein